MVSRCHLIQALGRDNPLWPKLERRFLDSVSNSEQKVETSSHGQIWNIGILDSVSNSEQKLETTLHGSSYIYIGGFLQEFFHL